MAALSLRTKFTFMGLSVLISVATLAYTGYSSTNKLLKLTQLEVVTDTIRHHMELDMMHDAIRGDVGNAMAGMYNKNTGDIETAQESLKEHITTVEENFKEIAALEVSPAIKESYAMVVPAFEAYTKKAQAMMGVASESLASGDQAAARAASEEFEASFKGLETLMSDTSDKVQAWAQDIKNEGIANAQAAQTELLVSLLLAVVLASIAPLYARFGLFRALGNIRETASNLANEDYDTAVPYTDRHDEIGSLASALEALRNKAANAFILKRMVDEMPINIITADIKDNFNINYANRASRATLQMLQQHLPASARELIGHSIDIFHQNPGRIRTMLTDPNNLPHHAKITVGPETLDLKVSAMQDKSGTYIGPMLTWAVVTQNAQLATNFEQSIGAVSGQISTSAGALQQSAITLQSAIEELSSTALEISKRTHESLSVVKSAAEKGLQANDNMQNLSDAAEKVAGVVTLIKAIAEKTNLLALNATIESARAGEAGKGFAVVANEVKNLAAQTGNAITSISAQVAEMQTFAANTAIAVEDMCSILATINQISTDISASAEQQQASTAEIARSVGDTRRSQQAQMETASVLVMATQLQEVSDHLKQECNGFLQRVRSM